MDKPHITLNRIDIAGMARSYGRELYKLMRERAMPAISILGFLLQATPISFWQEYRIAGSKNFYKDVILDFQAIHD
jgi:hypothetical protein